MFVFACPCLSGNHTHCVVKHGNNNKRHNQFLLKFKEKSASSIASIILSWRFEHVLEKTKLWLSLCPVVCFICFSIYVFLRTARTARCLVSYWVLEREHNQTLNFSKHHFPFKCFQFNDTFIRRLARFLKKMKCVFVCVCKCKYKHKQPRSLTGEL